jgi:hypothetical protein
MGRYSGVFNEVSPLLKYDDEKVLKFWRREVSILKPEIHLSSTIHIATSPSTFGMEILFS